MIIDEDVYLEHFNDTTIDQEVDAFLKHFGVKGMQWGVRNKRSTSSSKKAPLTAKEKREKVRKRNERIVKGMGYAYAALFVSSFFISSGDTKANTIKPPSSRISKSVADLINERRDVEVSALNRMHREGKMDSDQLRNFSSILNARYDRRVADALRNS